MELGNAQDTAAAKAAMARAQYREKLRENRLKIAEKLKDRPSLIERHELEMRRKQANTNALNTVASVVTDGKGKSKNEIFNSEEKMALGLDDDDSLGI